MGNKTDYPKININPEVVEKQELLNFAGQISAKITMEISAKNGYGLEQLFKLIQFDLFVDIEEDDNEQQKKKKEETKKKKKGGNEKCQLCCN